MSDTPPEFPNNWTAKPLYEAVISDSVRLQIHECVLGPQTAMLVALRLDMSEPTWIDGIWHATVIDWGFVQNPRQETRVDFLNQMIAQIDKTQTSKKE